ncbi:phosphopantetheine-binding protein [Streptomyces sp. NPDC085481]|uniref:phosphopantetheine-binding protein n=1 Tax=Streptomyces sp. NPDC085481 TaxID=3365727 RepID=UPI0037CFB0B4
MLNGTQTNQNQDVDLQEVIQREIDSVLLNDEGGSTYALDDPLLTAGLNSLLLAQLLLQLETELGVDPFAEDRSIADIRTIRDLIAAYDEAIRARTAGV